MGFQGLRSFRSQQAIPFHLSILLVLSLFILLLSLIVLYIFLCLSISISHTFLYIFRCLSISISLILSSLSVPRFFEILRFNLYWFFLKASFWEGHSSFNV